tara:strand:+ start:2078 stop:2533 length:456 start_codon:yes stop_codon:yes gene_type:complete
MRTPTSHYYYGAVLNQLIHCCSNLKIQSLPTSGNNSFLINEKVALYIKYTKKTISPWRFTFERIHQEEILSLREMFKHTYVVFVCSKDGIVSISYENLKFILDHEFKEAEWISFSRTGAQRYKVSGTDGILPYKLTNKSFPNEIADLLKKF